MSGLSFHWTTWFTKKKSIILSHILLWSSWFTCLNYLFANPTAAVLISTHWSKAISSLWGELHLSINWLVWMICSQMHQSSASTHWLRDSVTAMFDLWIWFFYSLVHKHNLFEWFVYKSYWIDSHFHLTGSIIWSQWVSAHWRGRLSVNNKNYFALLVTQSCRITSEKGLGISGTSWIDDIFGAFACFLKL